MSLVVYTAAALFGLAGVLLFRRPRAALRRPLTASTLAAVALGACCFFCSAPATLAAVNDYTGITNVGAPLTYSVISAYSCSLLILLIHWRGGPPELIWRLTLRSIAAYGTVIAGIIILFALADAPVERLRDLDTYYATTPYMREMIVLYLVGHGACTLVMGAVCWRWARQVTGSLRIGLYLIIGGLLLDIVGFEIAKGTAVVARWLGNDLDYLSTTVAPPVVSLGALVCCTGFVLPRLHQPAIAHWRSLKDARRLAPLWAEVQSAAIAPKPSPSWWHLPQARLDWLEVSIHDALLALAPLFDEQVRRAAFDTARANSHDVKQARVIAEAAMVADAAQHAAGGRQGSPEERSDYHLHATQTPGTSGLLKLAEALQHSPVVSAARHASLTSSRNRI
ncbi:MAB_1171c family putative transporter [Streptomyces sp. NPDC002701]|uniref:MAB_1171c family putative transporter n=1 Tax=Streptomyces sp. NPDC002701 TaxID=3364661 RepID=UPI003686E7F0